MSIWQRPFIIIRNFFERLFSGENPFDAFIQKYYGCPASKRAAKLQMKQKIYK